MTGYQYIIQGRCDNADTSIPGGPERAEGPDDDQVVCNPSAGHRHLHLRDGNEEGQRDGELERHLRRPHRFRHGFLQRDLERLGVPFHELFSLLDDPRRHGPENHDRMEHRDHVHVRHFRNHLLPYPCREKRRRESWGFRTAGSGRSAIRASAFLWNAC